MVISLTLKLLRIFSRFHIPSLVLLLSATFLVILLSLHQEIDAQNNTSTRKVNVPYWGQGEDNDYPDYAITWFGRVDPTSNYADVRTAYTDDHIEVIVHIIDRRLWRDPTPTIPQLTNWDAVSLYLNLVGNVGQSPGADAYRFIVQLGAQTAGDSYQVVYRGNGSTWAQAAAPFTGWHGWRGSGFNNNSDDKGWVAFFVIPFSSLGLSGAPPRNATWGMAVAVHDRDDATGTPISDQVWPETMNSQMPSTWGQLGFGIPRFTPPTAVPQGITTVRQGLNGQSVPDGHVGGHTICGDGIDHWSEWGEANYAGYTQINIQNQWDISDYPCFSKYYVTFPLTAIPPGKVIISARLTMQLFGNAGGGQWGEPPDSFVQVFSVGENWVEDTLTWNNAPLSTENFAGTWVEPVPPSPTTPPHPYVWDVSIPAARAYASGEPLRLALYSADGPMHTGKYFWSSNTGDWDANLRPTVEIVWGDSCNPGIIECRFMYLPLARK